MLSIINDPDFLDSFLIVDEFMIPVGTITSKHWIAREIAGGSIVLHASINSVNILDESVTVRIVLGDQSETFKMPPKISRVYHVGISGESYRQPEISRTKCGEIVRLVHDAENQHDRRAIAVLNAAGNLIGYLPRDGWLTDALLDEAKSYHAEVFDIIQPEGPRKFAAVVLSVRLG